MNGSSATVSVLFLPCVIEGINSYIIIFNAEDGVRSSNSALLVPGTDCSAVLSTLSAARSFNCKFSHLDFKHSLGSLTFFSISFLFVDNRSPLFHIFFLPVWCGILL